MNTQEHLLTCLSEECFEVGKDVSKALRFGLDDRNVLEPNGPTNRERIAEELNDLMAVIAILHERGILPDNWQDSEKQFNKRQKIGLFMAYAEGVGALQRNP